jgi:hypothetical protein
MDVVGICHDIRIIRDSHFCFRNQVLIYSLEKYDEKFLMPELHSAIGAENVRAVRVSLSLDTADLAEG